MEGRKRQTQFEDDSRSVDRLAHHEGFESTVNFGSIWKMGTGQIILLRYDAAAYYQNPEDACEY